MSRHTPGPWDRLANPPQLRFGDCRLTEQVWGSKRVCFIESQNVGASTALANACLIAAAPELLEACKELREALAAAMRFIDDAGLDVNAWAADLDRLGIRAGIGVRSQAVIAKAEAQS